MNVNYTAGGELVRYAYLRYREDVPREDHHVMSFVAGWNAAKSCVERCNDDYVLVDKGALQMAFNVLERNGKQEIADELRKTCKLVEL